MSPLSDEFIAFCIECGVLRFGRFVTKSGRVTPYFFNAGLFNTGAMLERLSGFYARSILQSALAFDMLFGPAYKGIALAAATAMALARAGRDVPFAFNRKEAKDHGEGGSVIGAPLAGKVLIVDDVITAGTAVGESVRWIRAAGAQPAGVALALDRMERGKGTLSAIEEVKSLYGMPVLAVATLEDLLAHLRERPGLRDNMRAIEEYREQYGVPQNA